MARRRYAITVTIRAEMEFDDAVFAQVDEDWRRQFYRNVRTPDDVAEHVGGAMIKLHSELSGLDGFADLPDSAARIVKEEWEAEAEPIR